MALEKPQTDGFPVLRRIGKRRLIIMVSAVLVVLALVAGGATYALLNQDRATVTITPASSVVSNTYTLSGVPGQADPAQNQVQARQLSANTPAQTKTVNASGNLSLQATQAHGLLVINNWDKVPKTFEAGTVLPFWNADAAVTCGDGVHAMVLDDTVTVPAVGASPSEYKTAYVPAHVQDTGIAGNIPGAWGPGGCWYFLWAKGAKNSCPYGWFGRACTIITVDSAFTGGQDGYDGPTIQQSDIDAAAKDLISANRPNPQQVLQRWMQPNEQIIDTPQCTPNLSPYQQAGDHAAQVTVSLYYTCTAEVYDQQTAFKLATRMLTTQATTDLGTNFALVGNVKTALISATFGSQGIVQLTIQARGMWAYHFTDAQKQQLAQLLAGKGEQEALQLAGNQPGVAYVTVHLLANQQRLPSDSQQIAVVVQAISGA